MQSGLLGDRKKFCNYLKASSTVVDVGFATGDFIVLLPLSMSLLLDQCGIDVD